jgi:hypothetical protein
MSPARDRGSSDPRGTGGRFLAAVLTWVALIGALAWVFVALRLTREDVAGIDSPGMPIALIQFVLAVLGALSAGMGASRAGWYVRTGRGGPDAVSAIGGAAILFVAWAALVIADW